MIGGEVDESPERLSDTPYFSLGSKIYGQGFLFDDDDPDANPDYLRRQILEQHPHYASRILPYIGGEDINTSATLEAPRHVIFLSDLKEEDDLERWPELEAIVRARVKPVREALGDNPGNDWIKEHWWAYARHRPELYDRVRRLPRALANSGVSSHFRICILAYDLRLLTESDGIRYKR